MITQIKKRDYTDKENDILTEKIIACCFKVHSELGPGFNEKIYHNALKIALKEANLEYQTEKEFPVSFQGKKIGSLKLDLIIENKVILELKALLGNIPEVFKYQLLSLLSKLTMLSFPRKRESRRELYMDTRSPFSRGQVYPCESRGGYDIIWNLEINFSSIHLC